VTHKPVKIAILLSSLKFGGAERVALNLAMALKAEGIQIDFLLMSYEGEFLAEAERHFTVLNLRCDKTFKLPGRLRAYLARNNPDALISSFWKLNLCACLVRILDPSTKLILWEHSPPSKSRNSPTWLYAITASLLYRLSTRVVAVSTGVFKDIDRITLGLHRKLLVIFNPITPPPADLLFRSRRYLGKRVIWVGRLDGPKNPGLMLDAFALVAKARDVSLAIVGDGHLRSQLEEKCKVLGLDQRVSFLGYLPEPYVEIGSSDLLVLSSDREGFGNVVVEAMLCGLRVVSTDCGEGVHDILLDGRYGTIVPPNNAFVLARAIESELLKQPDAQEQVAGAQRFLPKVIAHQFMAAIAGDAVK